MTFRFSQNGRWRTGLLTIAATALLVVVILQYIENRTVALLPVFPLLLFFAAAVASWRRDRSA